MTAESIAKKIEAFVKRRFRGCDFIIKPDNDIHKAVRFIDVILTRGDFTPYRLSSPHETSADCYIKVSGRGFHGYAEELDSNLVVAQDKNYYTLTKESEALFKELVDFIKKSFSKIDYVKFVFVILGPDYYKDTSVRPGTIPKPTNIDHKTFKGRKRRSVVEAIIDSYRLL